VDLFGWWNSRGFSEAGRYVLSGTFPRTWPVSALQLAVVSAAARHEDDLKRPSAVHLFSDQLPFKRLATHWLGEQKLVKELDPLVTQLEAWNRTSALRQLSEWAAVEASPGEVVGSGRRLEALSRKDLTRPDRLEKVARLLAACYARLDNPLRFPYFDLTS
jgi:hypothetical protein